MATTFNLKPLVDVKRWEMMCPAPATTAAGTAIASSRHYKQSQLFVVSNTTAYLYFPETDGWVQVPSPALATAVAAGFCAVATAVGPSGTATAGTTTTLTTNLTLARDLRGYSINITAGPGAGDTRVIASNTTGANAVITVTTPFSAAITTSSTYRLLTPRWYTYNPGSLTSGTVRLYDYAKNAWSSPGISGLPATWGTEGRLMSTPSWMGNDYLAFATGTATAGASTTLTNSNKSWATNQWANYQVRIVSGTGAGQIRTIASNTSTALTVSAAWTITPDNTSVYSIEGNDDYLYLMGNNAITMYRFSISGNTWTTLSPSVARGGAPIAGSAGHWVYGVTDAAWTNESAIINGRRLYSFRGGASTTLDYYDIPSNSWTNAVTYAPATETFTTGTKWAYNRDYLYIQKDATGRFFRYNFATNEVMGWSTLTFPQGAAVLGDTMFDVEYQDGSTIIPYIYILNNTSTSMFRQMAV